MAKREAATKTDPTKTYKIPVLFLITAVAQQEAVEAAGFIPKLVSEDELAHHQFVIVHGPNHPGHPDHVESFSTISQFAPSGNPVHVFDPIPTEQEVADFLEDLNEADPEALSAAKKVGDPQAKQRAITDAYHTVREVAREVQVYEGPDGEERKRLVIEIAPISKRTRAQHDEHQRKGLGSSVKAPKAT